MANPEGGRDALDFLKPAAAAQELDGLDLRELVAGCA